MFMKLKYTTRHLNFYFLKIHILRLLFCVYIVGMAGFVLASRRNDGQETNKKSFGKSNNKLFGKSNDLFPNTSQKKDLSEYLMHFARKGSVDNINRLVNAGADVNARNNKGETTMIIAVKNNKDRVVKTLLGHNADITLTDYNGDTAFTHNQNQTKKLKSPNKFKSSNKQQSQKGIEDQLCTRFAHDHMKKAGVLNSHTRIYHCGKGKVVLASGVARRQANNGDSKTLFPERWIEKKIAKGITSVLHSPEKLIRRGSTKLVVKGERKEVPTLLAEGNFKDVSKEEGNFNVSIRVIIAKNGSESNVVTAYPLIDKEEEKAYCSRPESRKR